MVRCIYVAHWTIKKSRKYVEIVYMHAQDISINLCAQSFQSVIEWTWNSFQENLRAPCRLSIRIHTHSCFMHRSIRVIMGLLCFLPILVCYVHDVRWVYVFDMQRQSVININNILSHSSTFEHRYNRRYRIHDIVRRRSMDLLFAVVLNHLRYFQCFSSWKLICFFFGWQWVI